MERTLRHIEDELLVIEAQIGDAEALALLAERWQRPLLRHATHLLADPAAAAEATQEAWLGITRNIRRVDDPARFGAWALRIVSRRCADWIRARRRTGAERLAADPIDPHEQSGDAADIARLRLAMRGLAPETRALLSLFYQGGHSVGEIAAALEIPPGTVKSRLFAARAQLRDALEDKSAQSTPVSHLPEGASHE